MIIVLLKPPWLLLEEEVSRRAWLSILRLNSFWFPHCNILECCRIPTHGNGAIISANNTWGNESKWFKIFSLIQMIDRLIGSESKIWPEISPFSGASFLVLNAKWKRLLFSPHSSFLKDVSLVTLQRWCMEFFLVRVLYLCCYRG